MATIADRDPVTLQIAIRPAAITDLSPRETTVSVAPSHLLTALAAAARRAETEGKYLAGLRAWLASPRCPQRTLILNRLCLLSPLLF